MAQYQPIYGNIREGYSFGPYKPNPWYFDSNNGPEVGRWSKQGGFERLNDTGGYGTDSLRGRLSGGFGGSGGFDGSSSIGGVSAVNPQAGQANELDAFKRYEDAAWNSTLGRLTPQFDRQNADFDQGLVSRGIPVGSDAYNSAMAQKNQSQAGAMQDAALGAMQFGLGAQNQSFQQDATRSGLANALLQSRWQTDLGWANNALGRDSLSLQRDNLGLQRDALTQAGQQFKDQMGYNYDTFYDTLGQRNYEFDANQDYNYWDRGNQFDYMYDRANSSDYFGAYDRDFQNRSYMDSLFLSLFGGASPGVQGQNAGGIYGQQIGNAQRPGFDLLYGLGFL